MVSLRGPSVDAEGSTLSEFSKLLNLVLDRPVIDKTGLPGAYNFALSWDETPGPSLVTALPEQLGLRFESERVPVSLFVIDSAQKPTQN